MEKGREMNELLKNKQFIIFGEDFQRHPHALEHLLRPLFNDNQFIWVETIGLRSPKFNFYDLKRIFEKISKWTKTSPNSLQSIPQNISIIRPFMIPFNQFKLIRIFNRWSVDRAVLKKMNELNIKNPISIASVPNAADYVGNYQEKLKLYFCVDEFSLWPGLNYQLVSKLEKTLMEKVDCIMATSSALVESKIIPGKKTILIDHGVEFEHFNLGRKQAKGNPLKICYFGLFDQRNNQELLAYIANHLPEDQIDIIGNVVCETHLLKNCSNIKFLGPVSYQALPEKIKQYDIFILPYVENELTRNINPLKLKEYISTSRFIISTPLPEVLKFKEFIAIGKDGNEFVNHINYYRTHGDQVDYFNPDKAINYIKANETWEIKALKLSNLINQLENQ